MPLPFELPEVVTDALKEIYRVVQPGTPSGMNWWTDNPYRAATNVGLGRAAGRVPGASLFTAQVPTSEWIAAQAVGASRVGAQTGAGYFTTPPVSQQFTGTAKEWLNAFLLAKVEKIVNPEIKSIIATFKEYETWVGKWFSHETFDIGQTDEEAINSFHAYVNRYEYQQNRYYEAINYPNDYHCLMGSEEIWRLKSGADDYEGIPCRCEKCKASGMLMITH